MILSEEAQTDFYHLLTFYGHTRNIFFIITAINPFSSFVSNKKLFPQLLIIEITLYTKSNLFKSRKCLRYAFYGEHLNNRGDRIRRIMSTIDVPFSCTIHLF